MWEGDFICLLFLVLFVSLFLFRKNMPVEIQENENKGANLLCSYCTADLRLCFRIGETNPISRHAAQIIVQSHIKFQIIS